MYTSVIGDSDTPLAQCKVHQPYKCEAGSMLQDSKKAGSGHKVPRTHKTDRNISFRSDQSDGSNRIVPVRQRAPTPQFRGNVLPSARRTACTVSADLLTSCAAFATLPYSSIIRGPQPYIALILLPIMAHSTTGPAVS